MKTRMKSHEVEHRVGQRKIDEQWDAFAKYLKEIK